jgi:hypothetical protein
MQHELSAVRREWSRPSSHSLARAGSDAEGERSGVASGAQTRGPPFEGFF